MATIIPLCLQCYDGSAMAAFRVCLGVLVAYELVWHQWGDRCAMFADDDESLFPPYTMSPDVLWPNLHTVFPGCGWTSAVMAAQIAAALLLALGVHPNACALLLWFASCSQMRRNSIITCGSDCLKRCCLMWAAVMPLGDSHGGHSGAVAGLRVQVAIMYTAAAMCKHQADPDGAPGSWRSGTAVEEVLSCWDYRTPIGDLIAGMPAVCRLLTYATLVVESLAPLALLLGRGTVRKAAVVALLAFHIGIGLCMELGTFSEISCTAILIFWEAPRPPRSSREDCRGGFLSRLRVRVCAALLALMAVCHVDFLVHIFVAPTATITSIDTVDWSQPRTVYLSVAHKLGQIDPWRMFERPPADCGSYRLPARRGPRPVFDARGLLYSGEPAPVDWSLARYPAHEQTPSWGAVYERMYETAHSGNLYTAESVADFYCSRLGLDEVSVVFVRESPPQNVTLYSTRCSS